METTKNSATISACIWIIAINTVLFIVDNSGLIRPIKSPIERAVTPIQSGMASFGRLMVGEVARPLRFRSQVQERAALQQQRDELFAENTRLKLELEELRQQLELQTVTNQARIIQAGIIESGERFVIDKGAEDGVVEGGAVASGEMLVGVVNSVSPRTSVVNLTTDPAVKIPALVLPDREDRSSDRVRGLAVGSFNQEVELTRVPADDDIEAGEIVVTAAGINIPRYLIIGEIVEVRSKQADLFSSARVRPMVDFNGLASVTVIVEEGR